MNWATSFFLLASIVTTCLANEVEMETMFAQLEKKYGRNYSSQEERDRRYEIFKENYEAIEALKREDPTLPIGMTNFFDVSRQERMERLHPKLFDAEELNSLKRAHKDKRKANKRRAKNVAVPEHFDLRDYGLVTNVKDQKLCGSCYSFSAAAVLETSWLNQGKRNISFSPQSILDCCKNKFCNNGCDGGSNYFALKHARYFGIAEYEDYPYKEKREKCDRKKKNVAYAYNVKYLFDDVEEYMYTHRQAASIALSTGDAFSAWNGTGVIDERLCAVGRVDHAAAAVGWGTEGGREYWIVKNSWGEDWGEKGYFKIYKGICGIDFFIVSQVKETPLDYVAFPLLVVFGAAAAVGLTAALLAERRSRYVRL